LIFAQTESKFTKSIQTLSEIFPNFAQFIQICPNFTQICPNFTQIGPNFAQIGLNLAEKIC